MDRYEPILSKIVSLEKAMEIVRGWQLKDDKVVFTNGCFDILHAGHVTYLAKAAEEGNRLVIGLNTDLSVREQGKGENRPINNEDARALVISSLHVVDLVVLFGDQTPIELIKALKPDVLAKGADYDADCTDENNRKYIVGSKEVRQLGGRVVAVPLVDGFSTTSIVNQIKG
jgi:D-glycero-beta-D-manno-heptose 1-phosphate adenylyltransferase